MGFVKHTYRMFLLSIVNLFRGMHFFKLKRFLLNLIPDISIGKGTRIVGPFWAGSVSIIEIGENSFINRKFSIEGNGTLIVGNNVDIGPNVEILTGGHKVENVDHRAGEGVLYSIKIENGVWVGACSIILGNTSLGEGCVVGAGTLVNRDCPSSTLIVGHPGRVKKEL